MRAALRSDALAKKAVYYAESKLDMWIAGYGAKRGPAYSAGGSARSAVRRAAAAEDSPTSSIPCSGAGVKRADRVSARTSQTHTLLPDGISKSAHPRQSSGTLYRYTEVTFQLHVLTGFEP